MSAKILIIDNDSALVRALELTLSSRGFAVSAAYSVEEAIVKINSELYDIALLDLKLGCRSGEELFTFLEIFSLPQPRAIIVMTGSGGEFDLARLRPQVAAIIEKPFSTDSLLKEIERINRPHEP